MARKNMEILVPYVINAAQILCTVGMNSREAWENMQVIRSRWLNQVSMLQLAIDDITSINDFLGTTIIIYFYAFKNSIYSSIIFLINKILSHLRVSHS